MDGFRPSVLTAPASGPAFCCNAGDSQSHSQRRLRRPQVQVDSPIIPQPTAPCLPRALLPAPPRGLRDAGPMLRSGLPLQVRSLSCRPHSA